jgi:hypothetical protein
MYFLSSHFWKHGKREVCRHVAGKIHKKNINPPEKIRIAAASHSNGSAAALGWLDELAPTWLVEAGPVVPVVAWPGRVAVSLGRTMVQVEGEGQEDGPFCPVHVVVCPVQVTLGGHVGTAVMLGAPGRTQVQVACEGQLVGPFLLTQIVVCPVQVKP